MKQLFLYSLIIIGFAACSDKKEDPMPTPLPATTTQVKLKENGMAVLLDYQASWSYESGSMMYGLGITQNKTGAEASQRKMILIRIHDADLTTGSIHGIGAGNDNEIIYFANHSSTNGQYKANKYFTGSRGSFTLHKTADVGGGSKAFYGTFSGTLINMNGDSVVITDGRIME